MWGCAPKCVSVMTPEVISLSAELSGSRDCGHAVDVTIRPSDGHHVPVSVARPAGIDPTVAGVARRRSVRPAPAPALTAETRLTGHRPWTELCISALTPPLS